MKLNLMRAAAIGAGAWFCIGAAQADECVLAEEAPAIPDGASATEEELQAVMGEIKAFQGALGEYRTCLNAIIDDKETYEVEARQAALDSYNASVEAEETMAAQWSETVKAFKENSDS